MLETKWVAIHALCLLWNHHLLSPPARQVKHLKWDNRVSAVSIVLSLSRGHLILPQAQGEFKKPNCPKQASTRCFMWQVQGWLVAGGRQFKHSFKPITQQGRAQFILVVDYTNTSLQRWADPWVDDTVLLVGPGSVILSFILLQMSWYCTSIQCS